MKCASKLEKDDFFIKFLLNFFFKYGLNSGTKEDDMPPLIYKTIQI